MAGFPRTAADYRGNAEGRRPTPARGENKIGHAFADVMDAYSRICVNETFMKGLKHDEQD